MRSLRRVEIYKIVDGHKIENVIGRERSVYNWMKRKSWSVAARAEGILNAHRDTGMSRIYVEDADVDFHVILDDPNAMSIEFGRKENEDKGITQAGAVAPLHKASGLPMKGGQPWLWP